LRPRGVGLLQINGSLGEKTRSRSGCHTKVLSVTPRESTFDIAKGVYTTNAFVVYGEADDHRSDDEDDEDEAEKKRS